MKNFFVCALTLILIITAITCKKSSSGSSGNNQNPGKPQATAVGVPAGNPTSKIIGASGGTIASADGSVELDIPPGALPKDTTITIQPITNNCPGGIMSAFRFSPDGLKFSQAATLKFHYPDSVLSGTMPDLMGIAVQDSGGFWKAATNFNNDTTAHSISASIMHFTDYSSIELIRLTPGNKAIKVSEHIDFNLVFTESEDDGLLFTNNSATVVWAVNGVTNGNSQYGRLTNAKNTSATYTAPGTPPSQNNPVQVSATLNLPQGFGYDGQSYNKIIVIAHVLVYDGGYNVKLSFEAEVNESGYYWNWKDQGSFDLVLLGNTGGRVANIQNSDATIVLDSSNSTCSVSLAPPVSPPGPINIIDSGTVIINPVDYSIEIIFKNLDENNYIKDPVWNYDCGGNTGQLGGSLGPAFPTYLQFTQTDTTKTIVLTPQYTMTVKPLQ